MRVKNSGPRPLWNTHKLLHPLNIEIYGMKVDSIPSLCLCHTPICAIELSYGTMLQNQAIRDTTGTWGQIPGHLATMHGFHIYILHVTRRVTISS